MGGSSEGHSSGRLGQDIWQGGRRQPHELRGTGRLARDATGAKRPWKDHSAPAHCWPCRGYQRLCPLLPDASWLRAFVRMSVPLLRPAVLGAWIQLFVIAVRVLDLAILLAGPGTRMLSVDIFFWTAMGRHEGASVLALPQTALVLTGYIGARLLLGRVPQQSAL